MENIEYRNFTVVADATDATDGKTPNYRVAGYATTFEPYLLWDWGDEKVFELVERTAFENVDLSQVIMLYNHNGRVLARCDNGTLEINVDEKGLHIRADLSKSQYAREIYEDIQTGLVKQMSWGFSIDKIDRVETGKNTTLRTIKQVKKVYEVSVVSIPANNQTSIQAERAGKRAAEERSLAGRKNALVAAINAILQK